MEFIIEIIYIIAAFLGIVLPLLLSVAFLTLAERKILALCKEGKVLML